MGENIDNEEKYARALEDFSERLIVIELPENTGNEKYAKYPKRICGIDCIPALINHEEEMLTPLPDTFESPYDNVTLWAMAIKNSCKSSSVSYDTEMKEVIPNMYPVKSYSGRALVCCDMFWNEVCEKLGAMRLIISMYKKDKTFVIASAYDDNEKADVKAYLNKANREDKARISYVYVRNVGMLSEASLNSTE